jgi:hypothetical protein
MHTIALAIAMLAISALTSTPYYEIPAGDHFQTGFRIGERFAYNIRSVIDGTEEMKTILRPFAENALPNFKQNTTMLFLQYVEDTTNEYPKYVQQLEGMSAGANVDVRDLWLLNLADEIESIVDTKRRVDGHCSDVYINYPNHKGIGHNEDGDKIIKKLGFISRTNIIGEPSLLTYNYPCQIAGSTFGFSDYGLVVSVNSLYPTKYPSRGLAINFVMRDLITAKDMPDLLAKLVRVLNKIAYGFNLNVADAHSSDILNIEVAPGHIDTLVVGPGQSSCHFNKYLRLVTPQEDIPSSQARLVRYNEYPPITENTQVLQFLGDTKNKEYPVYRTDDTSTLVTGYFDLHNKTLDIYEDNPSLGHVVYTFLIPNKR